MIKWCTFFQCYTVLHLIHALIWQAKGEREGGREGERERGREGGTKGDRG